MSNFSNQVKIPKELNEIGSKIINCAFKVHSKLGPGLFESIYEQCFVHELVKTGLKVDKQISIPIIYDDLLIKNGIKGFVN